MTWIRSDFYSARQRPTNSKYHFEAKRVSNWCVKMRGFNGWESSLGLSLSHKAIGVKVAFFTHSGVVINLPTLITLLWSVGYLPDNTGGTMKIPLLLAPNLLDGGQRDKRSFSSRESPKMPKAAGRWTQWSGFFGWFTGKLLNCLLR